MPPKSIAYADAIFSIENHAGIPVIIDTNATTFETLDEVFGFTRRANFAVQLELRLRLNPHRPKFTTAWQEYCRKLKRRLRSAWKQ